MHLLIAALKDLSLNDQVFRFPKLGDEFGAVENEGHAVLVGLLIGAPKATIASSSRRCFNDLAATQSGNSARPAVRIRCEFLTSSRHQGAAAHPLVDGRALCEATL